MIPKMEQHLQQQQQDEDAIGAAAAAAAAAGGAEDDDNNEDDSRFEVPTDTAAASIVAADAINSVPSTNATLNYGDGASDLVVEDRIK